MEEKTVGLAPTCQPPSVVATTVWVPSGCSTVSKRMAWKGPMESQYLA